MKIAHSLFAMILLASPLTGSPAVADDGGPFPDAPTFSTLITTPRAIEGLTGDNRGNLYVGTRNDPAGCSVYRINIDTPSLVVVGTIPATCSTLGLAFDHAGMLYVTNADKIYRFFPDATNPPVAALF